jgi:hypothetical protein
LGGRDWRWYTATVFWKPAVLFEYGRHCAVPTQDDLYFAYRNHVKSFLDVALDEAGFTPDA